MEMISVLVVIYNQERYIERCVQSIRKQTYTNLEIILIDDGSSDNTINIIKKMEQEDCRIKVMSIENNGVANARNKAIEQVTSDYFTFVDSDDYVKEDYVELLYSELKKHQADISVCNCINHIEKANIDKHKNFRNNKNTRIYN